MGLWYYTSLLQDSALNFTELTRVHTIAAYHRIVAWGWIVGKQITTLSRVAKIYQCWQTTKMTRACLGLVALLHRPRSVYRSNVECSFLSRNDGQMTLKIKVNDPHFQYQQIISTCIFGANLVILDLICYTLSHRQVQFLRNPNQNGQMTWGARLMFSIFNNGRKYPQDACANRVIQAEIWAIVRTGGYLETDGPGGRKEGQTQATPKPLQPERLRLSHLIFCWLTVA